MKDETTDVTSRALAEWYENLRPDARYELSGNDMKLLALKLPRESVADSVADRQLGMAEAIKEALDREHEKVMERFGKMERLDKASAPKATYGWGWHDDQWWLVVLHDHKPHTAYHQQHGALQGRSLAKVVFGRITPASMRPPGKAVDPLPHPLAIGLAVESVLKALPPGSGVNYGDGYEHGIRALAKALTVGSEPAPVADPWDPEWHATGKGLLEQESADLPGLKATVWAARDGEYGWVVRTFPGSITRAEGDECATIQAAKRLSLHVARAITSMEPSDG